MTMLYEPVKPHLHIDQQKSAKVNADFLNEPVFVVTWRGHAEEQIMAKQFTPDGIGTIVHVVWPANWYYSPRKQWSH
ncbi:MAG: hypothetical protein GY943_11890 [Chloroflexi bacterium]|nr:hypothetical protein [Chloroflexota bacterium]